jgi:2-polyprenyl-3-methyl-5-hydroxy-6-metoxy-1,4-benzoquinol methylase
MNGDLVSYYSERANEYEKIYSKSERQNDLNLSTKILQDLFSGKEVFEIACGTGYWTERLAKTAHSIVATDINDSVIEIARSKNYSPTQVTFKKEDIFDPDNLNRYESLFGGFIWSHIKLHDLNNFLDILKRKVVPGGLIVLMDNNYVEGSSLPVTETDEAGNTYQARMLENGTSYKVLKNFPSESFLMKLIEGLGNDAQFINLKHYWILKFINIRKPLII